MMTHSIRLRLTLWYAGSILVLLLATAFAARALVRHSLEQEFARSQETSAALVRGFFRVEIAEYFQIEPTLEHIVGELVIPDRHVHFLRPGGEEFVPRPGVHLMPLPPLDAPLREYVRPLDPGLAPGWGVRLTASAAPLMRQQRQVDRWVLLAVPLGVALALVAGWVLTGRTLRPVAAMADAADRITADDGAGRLPVAVPDDELGRLGARFNALLDRLDGTLAHQRRFLADAAHELRTPIARARGAGELALSARPGGAGDRAALEQSQRELETMSRLVDELLELARSDADRRPAALQRGFLDDVVADVAHAFDPLARGAGVTLRVDVPEEAPAMMEELSLRRLVGVLVDNAVRYSPAGSTVSVRVSGGDAGARLVVEDAGIGIPAEERGRLFERFFRGAGARRAAPDGSGLGLAIAAAIAERHGAAIRVEAAEPTGTRVVVQFPRVD
jgi:two-component system, OmpR family, sensor kinase